MSTQQTDAFWEEQQKIIENFDWWLDVDFYTADLLWTGYQEDKNLPVQTYNQLHDLYTNFIKENEEVSYEEMINDSIIHN